MLNFNTAVNFDNVSLQFKNKYELFNNLSLKIPFPSCCLLLGQTGSGKSSIFSLIKGIIPFINQQNVSGTIQIFDKKITNGNYYQVCKTVGLLTQDPEILSIETTLEYDIAFTLESLKYQKEEIREEIQQLAITYPLIDQLLERSPKHTSAGEITLIQIIIMLLTNPRVVLLDEPFSVLDYKQKTLILDILKSMKKSKSIVIATHEIEIFLPLVDYVLVLDKTQKKISFEGLKEEFLTVLDKFKWLEIPIDFQL
ncbi:MAG: ABC transporter ATP-binding protein [Candidatus Hodarchaeales archaeon]|jgi:energy-coupling factor transporter ATP-binding protein EcfA2